MYLSALISSLLAPLIRRLRRHLPPNLAFYAYNFFRRVGRLSSIVFPSEDLSRRSRATLPEGESFLSRHLRATLPEGESFLPRYLRATLPEGESFLSRYLRATLPEGESFLSRHLRATFT